MIMKIKVNQLRKLIREEIENNDYNKPMENQLYHEKALTFAEVVNLVPASATEAKELDLKSFWVNDIVECPDDPTSIIQGGKGFALAGQDSLLNDEFEGDIYIWDPEENSWTCISRF
jgi:hypothetical protein